MKYKLRIESFQNYGLNKFKNIFDVEGRSAFIAEGEEIFDAISEIIESFDVNGMAVFCHRFDDSMLFGVKVYDDDYEEFHSEIYGIDETNLDFFAEVDAKFGFLCYALLVECEPGKYIIVNN